MRKTIFAGASLVALVMAGPAFAQSTSDVTQTGNGNSAGVTQTGSNVSDIDQIGDGNIATAAQSGSNNDSDIDQTATGANNAAVVQNGQDSFADVIQDATSDGNSAEITQGAGVADATTAEITQTDALNGFGSITQDASTTTNTDEGSFAGIQQGNTGIFGGTVATAEEADSRITQTGSGNLAFTLQGGFGQTSTIDQSGPDGFNTAFVTQGETNGGESTAFVQQLGTADVTNVLQNSDLNDAFVVQIGTGVTNTATINQGTVAGGGGDDNDASILQEGGGNTSTITQNALVAGSGNSAENEQIGDGAISTITQEGSGNFADVSQFGANTSTVTQTGDGNSATVTQGSAIMIVN